MQRSLVLLILSVFLLSGCTNKEPARLHDASVEVVRVDGRGDSSEVGELIGRVLDDEYRPLQAVSVSLQGVEARTKTTAEGVFYFASVPARGYTVLFEKFGYLEKTQSVVVTAGQRTQIEAVLGQIANDGPFKDEGFIFRGKLNCSVRVNASGTNSNPECGAVREDLDNQRQRRIDLLPGVSYILVEVDWRPTVPLVNDKLTLGIRPIETESWRQIQGPRPLSFLITPDHLADMEKKYVKSYVKSGGQLQFFMFPGEIASQGGVAAGTTIQQDFTIYATAFYGMEPEPGYTRLPK